MKTIKLLSDQTINKIAAGEVIERPISVIKELVENAIDAGADEIIISLERGGKNLISVADNGSGIKKEELSLALQRHATSKLDEDDINNISFYGFRGEALPSIGAISKLRIITKTADEEFAWMIEVVGGQEKEIIPAIRKVGTTVEVFDIFSFTPARLKFMKSESSERAAAVDLIERFALANHSIALKLVVDSVTALDFKKKTEIKERVLEIFGEDFAKSHVAFERCGEAIRVYGYATIPTLNYSSQSMQYFFINKRVVKDKLLLIAIRAAYRNLIPERRYPALALFIEIDLYAVDVNVHPAKTEVRFREEDFVKGFLISTIRHALKQTLVSVDGIDTRKIDGSKFAGVNQSYSSFSPDKSSIPIQTLSEYGSESVFFVEASNAIQRATIPNAIHREQQTFQEIKEEAPLGLPKFQIFGTYIIAHSDDALVIIDQHAAHERLVLEEMKEQLATNQSIKSQILLLPEVIELKLGILEKLLEFAMELQHYGIEIERNGINQLLVRQIPALLLKTNLQNLFETLAATIEERDDLSHLDQIQDLILGNFACHHSIRAGRTLDAFEMEKILRDIERTPFAGQCNHGRPTYIKLTKFDLEKLFERR